MNSVIYGDIQKDIIGNNKIYYNQYYIGVNKFIHEDYNYININEQHFLSYHKNIPLKQGLINNKKIIVLGWTYRIDRITNDIFYNILSLEELLLNITGRFIIIYDDILYKDFLGTFDVFFDKKKKIIASDIHFFIENANYTYLDEKMDELDSLFFHLSPFLEYKDVYRLPATLTLNIKTLKRGKINLNINSNIKYNDFISKLYEYSNNIFHNMKNHNNNIAISLSAGYDSRALFQLLLESKIKFSIINHIAGPWKKYDEIILTLIGKIFNIEINNKTVLNSKNTLFVAGSEWDKFHCFLKDRNGIKSKKYDYSNVGELVVDVFGKILLNNKIFIKNLKYFYLYMRNSSNNWHIFDYVAYYFYMNNYYGARSYITDLIEKDLILILNSYQICYQFLKFPYAMTHSSAIDVINKNKILRNIPVNTLKKDRHIEKEQYLINKFNNFALIWLKNNYSGVKNIYE